MRRLLLLLTLSVVCCSGQMCVAPDQTSPDDAAQVFPVVNACRRSYYDWAFGFGFNPPPHSQGPFIQATDSTTGLLHLEWQQGVFTTFVADVGIHSPGLTLEATREMFEIYLAGLGPNLLADRFVILDNGKQGWYWVEYTPEYDSFLEVMYAIRGDRRIHLSIYYFSNASEAHVRELRNALFSLCVDD